MSPTWSTASDGSPSNTRCYLDRLSMLFRIRISPLFSTVYWIWTLTLSNLITVIRENCSIYVNYRHPKTSTSIHSTLIPSVTGIVSLPLLPTSRPSRDSGKALPAWLPHSLDKKYVHGKIYAIKGLFSIRINNLNQNTHGANRYPVNTVWNIQLREGPWT